MPLLEIAGLAAGYGRITVLTDVGVSVDAGEVVALLGANGAGKSTLCRAVSGLIPVRAGSVRMAGQELKGRSTTDIVRSGLVQVPEGRQVFGEMTVLDNLRMGAFTRRGYILEDELRPLFTMFPALKDRIQSRAGLLSGGEQQMLAISRALMAKPRVLLLDEPSQGLGPAVVDNVSDLIRDIAETGVAVLLVEQNLVLAEAVAERVYVLEAGRCTASGLASEILGAEIVQKAYLGI